MLHVCPPRREIGHPGRDGDDGTRLGQPGGAAVPRGDHGAAAPDRGRRVADRGDRGDHRAVARSGGEAVLRAVSRVPAERLGAIVSFGRFYSLGTGGDLALWPVKGVG